MNDVVIPEPVDTTAQHNQRTYSETPAGRLRTQLGITEVRHPHEAAELVRNSVVEFRARRGRDPYPEELRNLEWLAERRTTVTTSAREFPRSAYDIAKELRWGIVSPPPRELAAADMRWVSLPPAG